jgi:DNA-binding NtrC family response regulator
MCRLHADIAALAPGNFTVLIRGETGTGKELVAHALHALSARSHGPFVAVNCAGITDSLAEAELFGHEPGAFTGARERQIGKFEQAHTGTLFLDELAELHLPIQAMLLRILEDPCFQRVGGSQTLNIDVRFLAATNKNLEERREAGAFRDDLFYRLDFAAIQVPPLRDHMEDLPALVQHFLALLGPPNHKNVTGVAEEAMQLLGRYHWPGNVRQLKSVINKALARATGSVLTVESLPPDFPGKIAQERSAALRQPSPELTALMGHYFAAGEKDVYEKLLTRFDTQVIAKALLLTHGNIRQAASWLGLARNTFCKKVKKLHLPPSPQRQPDP